MILKKIKYFKVNLIKLVIDFEKDQRKFVGDFQ